MSLDQVLGADVFKHIDSFVNSGLKQFERLKPSEQYCVLAALPSPLDVLEKYKTHIDAQGYLVKGDWVQNKPMVDDMNNPTFSERYVSDDEQEGILYPNRTPMAEVQQELSFLFEYMRTYGVAVAFLRSQHRDNFSIQRLTTKLNNNILRS